MRKAFTLAGQSIPAGTRRTIDIPVSVLANHTPLNLPVHVVHGQQDGPVLFVSAAVHGDEIQGVEIIRRLIRSSLLRKLAGTLLAIPVVNAYGFINRSRYLPDRRDLNRSFPGSKKGSLAGQLANLMLTEVIARSDVGIDLHTAAEHRINLPQIRTHLENDRSRDIARAFGAPVIMRSPLREGSLRQAAQALGVDVLVYESGEALRFDELAARAGIQGLIRVMKFLGMLSSRRILPAKFIPQIADSSRWVRADMGGILRSRCKIGTKVAANEVLGVLSDPFGENEVPVVSPCKGLIIGRANIPVVNQGDALFHVAILNDAREAQAQVKTFHAELQGEPLFDEDEII